jgi:hypothetical protein
VRIGRAAGRRHLGGRSASSRRPDGRRLLTGGAAPSRVEPSSRKSQQLTVEGLQRRPRGIGPRLVEVLRKQGPVVGRQRPDNAAAAAVGECPPCFGPEDVGVHDDVGAGQERHQSLRSTSAPGVAEGPACVVSRLV